MTSKAKLLYSVKNEIGEGPLWHPGQKCLYWVDITSGDIFKSDPSLSNFEKYHFNAVIGAFCFIKGGGMILATDQGFSYWKEDQPSIGTAERRQG